MRSKVLYILIFSLMFFTPLSAQKSALLKAGTKAAGKEATEQLAASAMKHELQNVVRQFSKRMFRQKMTQLCLLRQVKGLRGLAKTSSKERLFRYCSDFSPNLRSRELRQVSYNKRLKGATKKSKVAKSDGAANATKRGITRLKYVGKVPNHLPKSKEVNQCIEQMKKSFPHDKNMVYEIFEYPDGSYEVMLKGHPGNTCTKMKVRPDGVIEAPSYTHAGKGGAGLGHNEFLKHRLPNTKYEIPPGTTCYTDSKEGI